MNIVLSNAQKHFKEQLQNNPCDPIHVPEWDCTIHYRPMTGKQSDAILKYVNEGALFGAMVESLIQRAKTEDNKPMFRPVERTVLMTQVDKNVVERVTMEMKSLDLDEDVDLDSPSEEDVVKNS